MNERRFVLNLTPAGFAGWVLLALVGIPLLLVLSFFFFAAMAVLIALTAVFAFTRIYWRRNNNDSRAGRLSTLRLRRMRTRRDRGQT